MTAATFILMYKQPVDVTRVERGAQVLHLGLRQGRRAGRRRSTTSRCPTPSSRRSRRPGPRTSRRSNCAPSAAGAIRRRAVPLVQSGASDVETERRSMTATAIETMAQSQRARPASRAQALGAAEVRRRRFPAADPTLAPRWCCCCCSASRSSLFIGAWPAFQRLRLRLLHQRRLEPAQGAFRRRRGDLRHAGHLGHRHG